MRQPQSLDCILRSRRDFQQDSVDIQSVEDRRGAEEEEDDKTREEVREAAFSRFDGGFKVEREHVEPHED